MSVSTILNLKRKENKSTSPLSIPKVLHSIFECMDIKELLNFRLVNKQWNEECTYFLLEKVAVVLRTWNSGWNSVDNFVTMFNSSKQTKPFKSIKLDSSLQLKNANLQEELGKIGLHFTSLTIGCHCNNAEEWTTLLDKMFTNLETLKISGSIPFEIVLSKTKSLPFLKSMTFNITNKRSEHPFIRKFCSDLFSVTPNLSSVTWGTPEIFTDLLPRAMFQCLMEAEEITGITEFCCSSLVFGMRELKELSSKNFPLKRLEISINADVHSDILGEFLELHGETLKILHLSFGPSNSMTIRISTKGKLKNLHTLTLEDYKRSLGFIINMNKLKKLVLINSDVERAFSFEWDDDLVKCLPKLDIFEVHSQPWRKVKKFPMVAIIRLAFYFPTLRVLRLQNLDDKCLRRVFRNFPYLVELRAPCGIYTDDAFKVLSTTAKFISDSEGCARSSGVQYLKYSYNQANLISLRRLEIDSVCMSDEFILEGIIKWKGIRHLALKNCRIEQSTLTRILMEMNLYYLKLESCEILSQHEMVYVDWTLEIDMVKDIIEMNYGNIKKWRRAVLQLLAN